MKSDRETPTFIFESQSLLEDGYHESPSPNWQQFLFAYTLDGQSSGYLISQSHVTGEDGGKSSINEDTFL